MDATLSVEGGFEPFGGPRNPSADVSPKNELQRGQLVGRFFIVERLGVGGMGVVYRAYDPELHRQLAIKLLHPSFQHDAEDRSRLLREAQAMAQVSHPNVITIHDVGTLDDKIYIAMELVEGRTLSGWLSRTQRTWQEVIATFVQAGRGLAAAHAEDLVHRDFKPDNVMIDDKGRVRVMDFGLARSSGVRTRTGDLAAPAEAVWTHGSTLDTPLTREGALMGTPAYMAAEQFDGLATDARTDQFAYCVAVWEGLFGLRPFAGGGISELMDRVAEGDIRDPPSSDVPRAVERMLRRGLRPAPGDRWPKLLDLVDALEASIAPKPKTSWLPWAGAGGTVAAAVGLTLAAATPEEKCSGAEAALAETWNESRADNIGEAFKALGERPEQRWPPQRERLDRYAESWKAMHTEACEATAVRGDQSEDVLDLRMACLRRSQHDLDETLAVLETPDRDLSHRLYRVVDGIASVDHCADVESLQELSLPPAPSIAEAVEEADRMVARAGVLARAGRFADSLETGVQALERARRLDYGPLITDATLTVANAHADLSHFDEAVPLLVKVQRRAVAQGQWRQAVIATARYIHVVGHFQSRPAEALAMRELGLGLAQRADDPHARVVLRGAITAALGTNQQHAEAIEFIEGTLAIYDAHPSLDQVGRSRELENLSELLGNQGEFEAALSAQLEAIEIFSAGRGEEHPEVARKLSNLGATYSMMGRNEEAEATYRKALALQEQLLPPGHLDTVICRANIAAILASQDRMEDAEPMYRQVLAGLEAKLGGAHPHVIMTRYNLAGVLRSLDRLDEAEATARRALADAQNATGTGGMRIAGAAAALASVLLDKKEYSAAQEAFQTAVTAHTEARGEAHPYTLSARLGLAETLLNAGRESEAEAMLRSSLAAGVKAHGDSVLEVARLRRVLADVLLSGGHADEARELLERAIPKLEEDGDSHLAGALFSLAQALGETPADRIRGVELATRAHTMLAALPRESQAAQDVATWLEAHPL